MSFEVLTPAVILVSRAQQKIIHPALNWIRKHDRENTWTSALTCCCGEALNYMLWPWWPCIVIPTEGPTKPFRYLRDPDPDTFTNRAIDIAKEDIGLDDEGAALAHIASTFILIRPEIAISHSHNMRRVFARVRQLHLQAKAEQAGGTP